MRRLLSLAIFVLALASAGALAAWGAQRAEGATDEFPVLAIGPEGGTILNARVAVADATVLRALQAAAAPAGVALELVDYPGMGTYVRAIGGHAAGGATGWVYEVHREGAWLTGDRSAERYSLQKGDAVRWSWTAG